MGQRDFVAGVLLAGGVALLTTAICASALGSAAAIVGIVPRLKIEVPRVPHHSSPLPNSATITNEFVPLERIAVSLRLCRMFTPDKKSTVPGPAPCSATSPAAGGLTMPDWQRRHFAPDEKWLIPMGSNVPFRFDTDAADIMIVVRFSPWLVPKSLLNQHEYRARFASHEKAGGQHVWIPRALDFEVTP